MALRPLVWCSGALLAAGCLRGPSSPEPAKAAPEATVQMAVEVEVKDYEFSPSSVEVSPGSTVTWKFDGPSAHTSTSNPESAEQWDSGLKGKGEAWSRKFDKAGTYPYHCTPHPFMKAKVVVK